MSKKEVRNALWTQLKFIFPKLQKTGDAYVNKTIKYKVFVDSVLVGTIGKGDSLEFQANMQIGARFDVLKGDTSKNNVDAVRIYSNFHWIVGQDFATLHLDDDNKKTVKLNFGNQNTVQVYDDNDYELLDEKITEQQS
tara:strand:- start:503 stop:916 length:414 start_codon:yes stop_codon:yes gene_type:complete